ncbi:MAG: MBL fold metallo-hydrolase [Saprospiraceae bacterium]
MKAKFWGCRGSLPASFKSESVHYKIKFALEKALENGLDKTTNLDEFIADLPFGVKSTYGTNTPCVEITGGREIIICDAGSGIRDLGKHLMSLPKDQPMIINVLMSHLHWDHLQGFPFFIPAYLQGAAIRIWGCHEHLEGAFTTQQDPPFFPVLLEDMGAHISFNLMDPDKEYELGGIKISIKEQNHPGLSYGYAFEADGQKIVYSTDIEHQDVVDDLQDPNIVFYKNADLLILDGQFNLADHLYTKQNWGHSSNLIAIEMATISSVKTLCLFHADHLLDDTQLDKFLADSRRYLEIYAPNSALNIVLAFDGMTFDPIQ